MLNNGIAPTAREWVDGVLASRDRTILLQIQAKRNYLAAKGLGQSGAAIHEIALLVNEELRTIAATSWTSLMNALRAMPPVPYGELINDVQAIFTEMLSTQYTALLETTKPSFQSIGDRGAALAVELIQKTYDALVKQYTAEIRLWAAAYGQSTSSAHPPVATYVFNGAVGAVQTGANSSASVVQHLGETDRAALLDAIRAFAEEVRVMPGVSAQLRAQGGGINAAIERELTEAEPNPYTLRGLFNGLSAFVQALGAAPAAYATVQSCASALGLM